MPSGVHVHPEALQIFPPHGEEKVRSRNALAMLSARFAEAQEKAGHLWALEQPAKSLMWFYEPVAKFLQGRDFLDW